MAFLATILIYAAIALFGLLILVGVFSVGMLWGKQINKPGKGWVSLAVLMERETYNTILDKGLYESDLHMVQDSISILNWALDVITHGRIVGSCEPDGTHPLEFNLETLSKIKSLVNPMNHLERCLELDYNESEE